MDTILMAVAVIRNGDTIFLRRMDPTKNPYQEPWGIFSGRIEENATILDSLNKELTERWGFTVTIAEKLWWNDEVKVDHDGAEKHFIYLGVLCSLAGGEPKPVNQNETLEWVPINNLGNYELNPPTKTVLQQLKYVH